MLDSGFWKVTEIVGHSPPNRTAERCGGRRKFSKAIRASEEAYWQLNSKATRRASVLHYCINIVSLSRRITIYISNNKMSSRIF